jgi:hypothetical protein
MDKKVIFISIITLIYVLIAIALSQEIIVYDDFSDPASGWNTFSGENGSVAYQDGWLVIKDTTNVNNNTKSYLNRYFSDFVIDLDTKLIEGSEDNWHTVYCRFQDMNNNYGFSISSDGYYGMDKWVEGNRNWFVYPTESEYIERGIESVNHIRIECVGDHLSFYVNDHLLVDVSDTSFDGGDIGLAASSMIGTFTKIAYDNFVVTEPA